MPSLTRPCTTLEQVEVLSHYGTEYYCPVSLFRVFGVSEFEVIDSMEDGGDDIDDDDQMIELSIEQVKEMKPVKRGN